MNRPSLILASLAALAAAGCVHHSKHERCPVAATSQADIATPAESEEGRRTAKDPVVQLYMDIAKEYGPHLDRDGDVNFRRGNRSYFIQLTGDQNYFRVVLPNFWSIDDEDEQRKVMRAANDINAGDGLAKIFVIRGDTWASVELSMEKPEDARKLFPTALDAIDAAVDAFKTKMGDTRGPIAVPSPDGTFEGGLVAYLSALERAPERKPDNTIVFDLGASRATLTVSRHQKGQVELSVTGFRAVNGVDEDDAYRAAQQMTADYRTARIYIKGKQAVASVMVVQPNQLRVNDAMDTILRATNEFMELLPSGSVMVPIPDAPAKAVPFTPGRPRRAI